MQQLPALRLIFERGTLECLMLAVFLFMIAFISA